MAEWKNVKPDYSLLDSSFEFDDSDHTFDLTTATDRRRPQTSKASTSSATSNPILSVAHLENGNALPPSYCVTCRMMSKMGGCDHSSDQPQESTMILQENHHDDSSDDIPLLLAQPSHRSDVFASSDEEMGDHCHGLIPNRSHAKKAQKRLSMACVLCLIFIAGEIVGGYLSNSLAIMTDASHLFSDFASFCISLTAIWLSSRPAKKSYNYGYYRAEALGALFTVVLIWYVTGILLFLSVRRIATADFEVEANPMMVVAGCAVVFNIVLGVLLHGAGHAHSHGGGGGSHTHKADEDGHSHGYHLNIRAALIHVLGDLIQSIGVLISSIIIKVHPEYKIADPICTVVFSVIVFCTTVTVFRDTVRILMEGSPRNLSYDDVRNDLLNLNDVVRIHDLRIWCLTTDRVALSVHLCVNASTAVPEVIIQNATKMLKRKYKIFVITIQVEDYKSQIMNSCEQCQEPVK